ncbi:deoxyhypusine synthase [Holotrichia oblita]|uniref:Deoxyhypusine synthase n=1 Tax=Holotrichia oblita TaxID=644536 RepID=A0ACB9TY67_HOLOL|nr:deoxyhypusine synthase [Holotrichia oblita]
MGENVPEIVQEAVLKRTATTSLLKEIVHGYNWDNGLDFNKLLDSYKYSGFQSTNFGLAVEEINKMIVCRNQPLIKDNYQDDGDQSNKINNNCTIFLGYTSNIVSSGLRETIKFLVKNKMIDCIVTTAGGIEEDFIKCFAPTFLGDFNLEERERDCMDAQSNDTTFREKINNEDSVYYWAAKNRIPVFCPALTDGSLGDMMFFHSFKNPGLILDILYDLRRLNLMAIRSANTGMIIIGGGLIKHHICNANLMRNGADYAVYINTSSEFDGSDSGARPDEAVSWGKIKADAKPVKIYAEATLVFPLIVAQTFAKFYFQDGASGESN